MSTAIEMHHGTRTVRHSDHSGRYDVYGHSEHLCNLGGCAGLELYLGSYDPTEVERDGNSFWVETDAGFIVTIPN